MRTEHIQHTTRELRPYLPTVEVRLVLGGKQASVTIQDAQQQRWAAMFSFVRTISLQDRVKDQ